MWAAQVGEGVGEDPGQRGAGALHLLQQPADHAGDPDRVDRRGSVRTSGRLPSRTLLKGLRIEKFRKSHYNRQVGFEQELECSPA